MRLTTRGSAVMCALAVTALLGASSAGAAVREYWVAAVPTTWNVIPNGHDAIGGTSYAPSDTVFPTVVYRRYSR
ncbi:MAG: hypothetical protein ACXVSF_11915, partial [Solirubrobacteraceae bacterium]